MPGNLAAVFKECVVLQRYTCKLVSPLVSATDPDAAVLPALEIHDPHFVQTHWKATWIEG
jgi:hypothetical protein